MTGKELFKDLMPSIMRIGISDQNLVTYINIQETLDEFNVIDSFYQIKKNNKGEGLALEIMIFNEIVIHDFVFSRNDLDYISIPLNKVNMVFIESSYSDDENIDINKDKAILTIAFGEDLKLSYVSVTKRLGDLIRIKNNLFRYIKR